MDHSAFDAAAFEIRAEGNSVIYSGDFRGHGRKPRCLPSFISHAAKQADVLFTEGTMVSRSDEKTITEDELEKDIIAELQDKTGIALMQLSSQNIDRLVTFYKAARKLRRTLVVDGYTAYVLHKLHALGNKIPHPSYSHLEVFYPFHQGDQFRNKLDAKYAMMFSPYKITKQQVEERQNKLIMLARPSTKSCLERCNVSNGTCIYSMWEGYRTQPSQQSFEKWLDERSFRFVPKHTSGHARVADIKLLIDGLAPKKIVPIHTLTPGTFLDYSNKAVVYDDGVAFDV
jgi:ribonuclease J